MINTKSQQIANLQIKSVVFFNKNYFHNKSNRIIQLKNRYKFSWIFSFNFLRLNFIGNFLFYFIDNGVQ